MAPKLGKCPKCRQQFTSAKYAIPCFNCKNNFHVQCIVCPGLTIEEEKALTSKNITTVCHTCIAEIAKLQDKVKSANASIKRELANKRPLDTDYDTPTQSDTAAHQLRLQLAEANTTIAALRASAADATRKIDALNGTLVQLNENAERRARVATYRSTSCAKCESTETKYVAQIDQLTKKNAEVNETRRPPTRLLSSVEIHCQCNNRSERGRNARTARPNRTKL